MENNVSNYFPNVLAIQKISRNLTKKRVKFSTNFENVSGALLYRICFRCHSLWYSIEFMSTISDGGNWKQRFLGI